VNFEVTGTGKVAGVGNGNHSDMSGFQQPGKKPVRAFSLQTPPMYNLTML